MSEKKRKKIIKVERGVYTTVLTCLHAGKSACEKKRARQLANWQASQLAPTLKPPIIKGGDKKGMQPRGR
jgi:hypothetical protein